MKTLLIIVFLVASPLIINAQMKTWVAPKSANDIKNPFNNDETAAAKGKEIFNQICFVCHGLKGDGKGMGAASLNPKPANFLSISVRGESDGAIFWKITEGNLPMASYKDALTENQRWQLVSYIRTLEKINK